MSTVVIRNTGDYKSSIEIDGKEVSGVFHVEFSHAVGDLPKVKLELYPTKVEIVDDVEVTRVVICPACRIKQEAVEVDASRMLRAFKSLAPLPGLSERFPL